jgi:bifunctional non-homologous end joining protein LigD
VTEQRGALKEYQRKRDFARTPEPAGASDDGGRPAAGDRRFVVQRHRATRLHYDLRLELDGTLLSWAVPKGPTLDPSARRLAVRVEDHPVEYAEFEGVIPSDEYGGGDVIVWDLGTWSPAGDEDVHAQLDNGSLHFDVDAEKLQGRFVLVRRGSERGKEQWLLLHKGDDLAVEGWDPEDHPRSVLSGRTNEEVAADPDLLWHSDRPPADAAERVGPRRFEPVDAAEIAALDDLGKEGRWTVQGRELRVTNLDKVLFPARDGDEEPVTKRELLRYHALVAPYVLPYLADRPVNLHRYPNGAGTKGFWQKAVPEGAPEWIRRWRYESAGEGETQWYSVIDDAPSLVWAANLAGFELHPWTSCTDRPDRPTWAYVDIDPGPNTAAEDLALLVRLHRTALEHLDVVGCPKVTGQRGVQVWIPVKADYSFDQTRAWVEKLSRSIGATVPDLVSWEWKVADRGGLARLDYTQNAINKTLVAPYSVRPRAGAPVSAPITWDDVDDPDFAPDRWTIRSVLDRLETDGDPLAPLVGMDQALPAL